MSKDCEAVAIDRSAGTQEITWVGYDENDFVYTPSANLSQDPIVDTTLKLNLGTHPTVRVQQSGTIVGSEIRVTLQLNSNETLLPIAAGRFQETVVVGASSRLVAIHPLGGDASFVHIDGNPFVVVKDTWEMADPTIALNAVRRVQVHIRAQKDAGSVAAILGVVDINGQLAYFGRFEDPTHQLNDGPFAAYTWDCDSNPITKSAWNLDDVRQAHLGYAVVANAGVQIAEFSATFVASNPTPSDQGAVKYWMTHVDTFGEAAPAAPPDGDEAWRDLPGLHTMIAESPGTYWFWARVYDSLYRLAGLIGPSSVEIT